MMTGKVWKYITEKLESEGACHFSLLDPDPLSTSIENVVEIATLAEKAGSDALMIGGSTIFGVIDDAVAKIGEAVDIPTILFPGNITGVSENADAMFFMTLLNSTNPYYIIGAQALAAPKVKLTGIETIPMAYLIVAPGKTASWVGDAKPFLRDKPKLPAMYAIAAELLGMKLVYLEAGSGAEGGGVPPEMIGTVSKFIDIPLIWSFNCCSRNLSGKTSPKRWWRRTNQDYQRSKESWRQESLNTWQSFWTEDLIGGLLYLVLKDRNVE
ncbi:MAG: phosphoglycerol geranylgeranyltransferase [Candidatus Thorarchaeota archaeon]|jgi:phosphoglycerol geranylgeranyltransferase